MIYDTHPPYAHQAHLPYAREPWKAMYVFQRLTTTILLVPYWAAYYSFFPRPQPSWSIRQCIFVNFTRRIYKVTEVAGVTWGTRNPEKAPKKGSLKETRFEWIEPLEEKLRTGIICIDPRVLFKRVGVFIWPKVPPTLDSTLPNGSKVDTLVDLESASSSPSTFSGSEPEQCLIGIFFHGGGYCHMSAHEKCRTSRIPRRLIKVCITLLLVTLIVHLSTGQALFRNIRSRVPTSPIRAIPSCRTGCRCRLCSRRP